MCIHLIGYTCPCYTHRYKYIYISPNEYILIEFFEMKINFEKKVSTMMKLKRKGLDNI